MNKITLAAALAGTMLTTSASAALMFDANVTPDVIFGSGNANGGFTVDQANGIELGLRGKLRHNAAGAPENTFNSNGDGTYSFDAGVAPTQASPTAVWSFEWSINSNFDGNGGMLDQYTYMLSLDKDPSAAVDMLMFNPIGDGTTYWDHAIGNNSTGNGGGTKAAAGDTAAYAALIADNNVAQNSWKPHWFLAGDGFDPTVDGTYDFALTAFDGNGLQVAGTSMQIIVGEGATAVSEPATIALLLSGVFGLVARRKRSA